MAQLYPFSKKTVELLSVPPTAGDTHVWLARAAAGLAFSNCITRENCARFLKDVCADWVTHRRVPDREIEAAVRLAYDTPADPLRERGFAWPSCSVVDRALAVGAPPLFDGVTDTGMNTADALTGLFAPEELICAGWVCEMPLIKTMRAWQVTASSAQFIVVNPMKGLLGETKDGKPSARCQSNVAERRFIVAEFDDASFGKENQARVASALAVALPLVMVVDSGGKSLHCWYDCRGVGLYTEASFFAAATTYGADRTRWDSCGWLRMPGGLRRSGMTSVRQKIVYWGGLTNKGGAE